MSELKNTNIAWIGETQSNWKIGKILQFFYEGKEKNIGTKNKNLLSLSYGKIVKKDINKSEGLLPASFSTYNIVDKGDIIIRPTDLQNDKVSLRTGLVQEKGIITSAYIDLKPYEGVNSNFFHKVLHSYDICKVFYNMGSGVRQGIGFVDIAKLIVFVPPLEEQKKIADFLDGKCAQIDEITQELEEKISKLEEYKKEIVFESVTKGIDSNVEYKDSGIYWIGRIPQHWKIIKAKYCFDSNKEIVGARVDQYERLALTLNGVVKRSKDDNEGLQPKDFATYQILRPNELVFKLIDLQNISTSRVGLSPYLGLVSPAYIILKSRENVLPSFAERFYLMMWYNQIFNHLGDDGVRSSLNSTELLELPYLVPPLEEQKKIADFLDGKCAQIDEITQATRKEIETLKQYKQSLIYEYVTGKREVPTNE